jgi:hypothetical protein
VRVKTAAHQHIGVGDARSFNFHADLPSLRFREIFFDVL